jgi:hypothetical protein
VGFFSRFFGKKPTPVSPGFDLSEANLRAVLGEENVKQAWGLAITPVGRSQPARDQVGGIPTNIGRDIWPECEQCHSALTFTAQVAVGPSEVLSYPEPGSVAIFICNSEPPSIDDLCITAEGTGTACFFVTDAPTTAPMFTAEQCEQIDATLARGLEIARGASKQGYKPFLLPSSGGFRARPLLERAFHAERKQILSTRTDESDDAASALWAAHSSRNEVALEINAFPDWVQAPQDDHVCACGSPMELVIQFDAFDDAINLGDAGRAYVFACARRCGPRSFLLRWDCC